MGSAGFRANQRLEFARLVASALKAFGLSFCVTPGLLPSKYIEIACAKTPICRGASS